MRCKRGLSLFTLVRNFASEFISLLSIEETGTDHVFECLLYVVCSLPPPKSTQLLHSTWSAPIYLSDDIDNQRGDLRGAQKEKK